MKKQKDRLVELLDEAEYKNIGYEMANKFCPFDNYKSRSEFVSDHLLANGVIVPPCKVGDKVYRISTRPHSRMKYVQETTISRIAIDNEGIWLFCTCNPIAKCVFGKTVFLSREEAEAKLKEGVQG